MNGEQQFPGYDGILFPVPLGRSGLFTDAPQTEIPASGLIRANNCTYYNQVLQKDYAASIWRSPGVGLVSGQEMFVDSAYQTRRIYVLDSAGRVLKLTDPPPVSASGLSTYAVVGPNTINEPTMLNASGYVSMVVGGVEVAGNSRKLFIFDSLHSPQVITADGTTRSNIALPAADWASSNGPFGGVLHRGAMYVWGNANNPHGVYASSVTNHEDFQTGGATYTYNVYPGESRGIVAMAVFRGQLWAFKYPTGVYYLVDTDQSRTNWYFTKHSDDFGACSPQSTAVLLNDLVIANNFGTLTSLSAALIYGNTVNADIFRNANCFRFAQEEVNPSTIYRRSMVYYAKKKQLLCTFQSYGSNVPDRICTVDYLDPNNRAKISWSTRDQANALFLATNSYGIKKPFYVSSDGNIYETDTGNFSMPGTAYFGSAYTFDAQTPAMDFSSLDRRFGPMNKQFEFVEIEYEASGKWDCSMDVYIDGRFTGTYLFDQSSKRSTIDQFPLNVSVADGLFPFFRRSPINGTGRTISLRFYNSTAGQGIRLVKAYIGWRPSGQQQQVG